MHVLVIPTWYHTSFNRIRGVFFKDQALAVASKVDKVGVVAPVLISIKEVLKTKSISFQNEKITTANVFEYIQPILAFPFWKRMNRALQFRVGKKMLKKYILQNGVPDVVHLQSALAGNLALWLLKEYNIPFVVTEHSSAFQRKTLNPSELSLAQKVFEKSCKNIAVSGALSSDLKKLFNQDFIVISNIVDTSFFIPGEKSDDEFVFLNVAHLNANKNHELLIKSFAVIAKDTNAQLIIAGEGEERRSLEALIKSLNLDDRVQLFGKATREEVRELMQSASGFVLSSKVETFGVVLIEAMSSGVPVIATKCGGPESIVNDRVGLLSEQSVEELSSAMRKMLNASYSPDDIVECSLAYSADSVATRLLNQYKECLL